jgi:protein TonB
MTEAGHLAPVAPRFAVARETAAAALMLSAAAHAGVILWAVSAAPTREMTFSAGGSTAIEVELVQGPDQPSAGGRKQDAGASTAQTPDHVVAHDAKQPAESAKRPESRVTGKTIDGPSEMADTSFTPEPRPAPVAAHQTTEPDAPVPLEAASRPIESTPPHPPAKPLPPAMPGGIAAALEPIAALDLQGGTPSFATIGAGEAAPDGSATASDMADGSDGLQGAAPRADNPAPEYPYVARLRGEYGRVVLRVEVSASGEAGQVLIERSSGYDILDRAAFETVKRWRFLPARRNGMPVTASVRVPIRFALR